MGFFTVFECGLSSSFSIHFISLIVNATKSRINKINLGVNGIKGKNECEGGVGGTFVMRGA
jgi:hypothetical protein